MHDVIATLNEQVSERRELPKGWRWAKLGDVCKKQIETKNPRTLPNLQFTYIDISSIYTNTKRIQSSRIMVGQEAPSRARQVVKENDVIISTTRPNLNAVAIVPKELDCQICSTGFCVLRSEADLEPSYLFAWTQHPSFVASLSNLVKGALYPAVTDKQVREQLIPLPPLETQKRIAALLDEQMAAVARARKAAGEGLEAAHQLKLSYLREIFECGDSSNWERVKLGNLLAKPIRTGLSKSSQVDSKFYCLTLSAVRNGSLDVQARKAVGVSSKEAERNLIKPGAFYVVRGNGNKSLVGRGGLAPESMEKNVLYPDLLFEVNPNPNQINANYLRWVWDSPSVRTEIESRAKTSAGIYKINTVDLESISIKLPPLNMQEEIAEKLRRQIESAEKLVKSLQGQLDTIEAMPSALLRRAFLGEL